MVEPGPLSASIPDWLTICKQKTKREDPSSSRALKHGQQHVVAYHTIPLCFIHRVSCIIMYRKRRAMMRYKMMIMLPGLHAYEKWLHSLQNPIMISRKAHLEQVLLQHVSVNIAQHISHCHTVSAVPLEWTHRYRTELLWTASIAVAA